MINNYVSGMYKMCLIFHCIDVVCGTVRKDYPSAVYKQVKSLFSKFKQFMLSLIHFNCLHQIYQFLLSTL